MRLKFPIWLAAFILLIAAAAHADPVMERAEARGAFIAAVPAEAVDASGTPEGFDVEVAKELAKRLGLPVQFVTPGWEAILSGKWDGKWDYAVASITPTPLRAEKIDFPALYRIDAAVAVVRANERKIERPRDASEKTIGVMGHTTFERYLRHELSLDEVGGAIAYMIDEPRIQTFRVTSEALQALVQGKVDAMVTSLAIARAMQKSGQPIKILPGFLFFEPIAVATAMGDREFDVKIAEAMEDMRADGTLSTLSSKWFGVDLGAIIP